MQQKNITTILIIAIIVIAPAAFYSGMKYAGKNITAAQDARGQRPAGNRQAGAGSPNSQGGRGGFVNGEILKKDDKSITVKMSDGGSKTIYLSETTSIGKAVDGTKEDLGVGVNVMVNGSANQDGSIMAQMVQIRPLELKK